MRDKTRKITVPSGPEPGHRIVVQIARDERKILFSKREMREYLQKREIQGRQIFDGMKKHFKVEEVQRTLGAGTNWSQGQEVCFELYIPPGKPHVLMEMLTAWGPPAD